MKHLHDRRSNIAFSPRGFTLLELVLALGLSSLLLAALYTALQMHWSSSALGQVEMERSQVARALFRRIETDLRSVVFRDSALSSSTDDGSSTSSGSTSGSSTTSSGTSTSGASTGTGSGSSASTGGSSSSTGSTSTSSTGTSSSTSTTTENYSTQKTGLFGDSQSLIVHLSLPSRASTAAAMSSNSAADGSAGYLGSDMQSVAYFLFGSSSMLAQQLSGSSGQQSSGLARMQGDRMAMQAADETGDLSSMASGVKLLAPEVASIQFEYFDGVSWTTSWDSATSNSIPNAVRVTIDFQPPVAIGGWYARPVSASTNRFQHTVALPLAQPYVPEDSL